MSAAVQGLRLLATLAWRNLWRHPRRSLILLVALALGVWAMVTLAAIVRGSMESHVEKEIRHLLGHVQIHAAGWRDDPSVEHRFVPPPALSEALARAPVVARAARVRVPAVVQSEREAAAVTLLGIDPQAERGLSFIAEAVRVGVYLDGPDDPGLLVGRRLAERLETGLGRRLVLMSQDARGELAERGFRVVGLFEAEPRSLEEAYVFTGRRLAQRWLAMGEAVSEIALLAPARDRLEELVAALRLATQNDGALEVATWREIAPLLVVVERVNEVVLWIWFVVVFAAMSFGLVNTLLMAVFERTREFGLLQALGMPPGAILAQVLIESLILLALGLVLGNALALATLGGVLARGIDLTAFAEGLEMVGMSPVIHPAFAPGDLAAANGLVVVLGLLASLYPAWRASRHVPIEAITRG
jgi:ABC-type lipoprotein release transport system permease subunit